MNSQDDQHSFTLQKEGTIIPLVDLVAQYHGLQREIDEAVASVISSGRFIGGEPVDQFSKAFAKYCETDYCIPCANGTDALEIALKTLGIGAGDEVILPAFTFVATMEAVVNVGANPILCDIDPKRYTINPEKANALVTSKTKAIIAVHLYGQMCDMDQLQDIAETHQIALVEDAAQAHGATYKGRKAGSIGLISTFSFFPGKNLGAYGDAGAITTNDEQLKAKAVKLANHGRLSKYDHEIVGRNSRMDALQAAVLTVKLNHLGNWNARRHALAVRYSLLLSGIAGIELPRVFEDGQRAWHLYVIRLKQGNREALIDYMKKRGIAIGVHYPIALSKLKVTAEQLKIVTPCEEAERASEEVVSLPLYPELTEQMQDYICHHITEYLRR